MEPYSTRVVPEQTGGGIDGGNLCALVLWHDGRVMMGGGGFQDRWFACAWLAVAHTSMIHPFANKANCLGHHRVYPSGEATI